MKLNFTSRWCTYIFTCSNALLPEQFVFLISLRLLSVSKLMNQCKLDLIHFWSWPKSFPLSLLDCPGWTEEPDWYIYLHWFCQGAYQAQFGETHGKQFCSRCQTMLSTSKILCCLCILHAIQSIQSFYEHVFKNLCKLNLKFVWKCCEMVRIYWNDCKQFVNLIVVLDYLTVALNEFHLLSYIHIYRFFPFLMSL